MHFFKFFSLVTDLFFLFQPANVIMTKDYKFKLIDFGCARKLAKEDGEVGGIVGNPEFTGEPRFPVICKV